MKTSRILDTKYIYRERELLNHLRGVFTKLAWSVNLNVFHQLEPNPPILVATNEKYWDRYCDIHMRKAQAHMRQRKTKRKVDFQS